MDTFKEQQELSDMATLGNAPWEVWKSDNSQNIQRPSRIDLDNVKGSLHREQVTMWDHKHSRSAER
jgi:hypothetical protein